MASPRGRPADFPDSKLKTAARGLPPQFVHPSPQRREPVGYCPQPSALPMSVWWIRTPLAPPPSLLDWSPPPTQWHWPLHSSPGSLELAALSPHESTHPKDVPLCHGYPVHPHSRHSIQEAHLASGADSTLPDRPELPPEPSVVHSSWSKKALPQKQKAPSNLQVGERTSLLCHLLRMPTVTLKDTRR